MEGYDIFVESFRFATIIPIIYIIVFVFKGKEKGILHFFSVLFSLVGIYIASVIPILLIVFGFETIKSGDIVAGSILDVISITFSLPFLSGLVKNIEKDFEVPKGLSNYIMTTLVGIVSSVIVTALMIAFFIGYISGDISFEALIAVLFMFVATIAIFIISAYRKKIAYDSEKLEELKIFERKVGMLLTIFIIIFFVVIKILGY